MEGRRSEIPLCISLLLLQRKSSPEPPISNSSDISLSRLGSILAVVGSGKVNTPQKIKGCGEDWGWLLGWKPMESGTKPVPQDGSVMW